LAGPFFFKNKKKIRLNRFIINNNNKIQKLNCPGNAALTLRSRLRCIILRKDEATGKPTKAPTSLLVLNEVVIDRGPSPYLSNIDLYLDGKHITSVQGDGTCRENLTAMDYS
jgi:NAD kinase